MSADGAVVQQGDFVLEERTLEGGKKPRTQKVLMVRLPTDVFLTVAQAKEVQFKLGPETYQLSGDQRKHLQALAGTL